MTQYLFSADYWLEAALRQPKRGTLSAPLVGIDAPLRSLKTAARSVAIARGIEAARLTLANKSADYLGT